MQVIDKEMSDLLLLLLSGATIMWLIDVLLLSVTMRRES